MHLGVVFLTIVAMAAAVLLPASENPYAQKTISREINNSEILQNKYFAIHKGHKDLENPLNLMSPKIISQMSLFKHKFLTTPPMKTREQRLKEACDIKSGHIVDGDCYQFFTTPMTFDGARTFCKGRAGDLWTPNFTDPYLLQKFVPNVINVDIDVKVLWIGAQRTGVVVKDINGSDITHSYFNVMNNDVTSGVNTGDGCAFFTYLYGAMMSFYFSCTLVTLPFVCEYPITLETVQPMTNVQSYTFGFPFPFKDIDFKNLWIGAQRTGVVVKDINGIDITQSYFNIMNNDVSAGVNTGDGCAFFSYLYGAMMSFYFSCTQIPLAFVCEYPITLETVQPMTNVQSYTFGFPFPFKGK